MSHVRLINVVRLNVVRLTVHNLACETECSNAYSVLCACEPDSCTRV